MKLSRKAGGNWQYGVQGVIFKASLVIVIEIIGIFKMLDFKMNNGEFSLFTCMIIGKQRPALLLCTNKVWK